MPWTSQVLYITNMLTTKHWPKADEKSGCFYLITMITMITVQQKWAFSILFLFMLSFIEGIVIGYRYNLILWPVIWNGAVVRIKCILDIIKKIYGRKNKETHFHCNIWHFARDRREQTTSTKYHKIVKNINILEFGDYIWNHHEKCIQISTNMPGIGLDIC